MKLEHFLIGFLITSLAATGATLVGLDSSPHQEESDLLISLGINNNPEVTESSGIALSRIVAGSFWTMNDSGHPSDLWLLTTRGKIQAKISIANAKNVDWEAMAGFLHEKKPYLLIADVGDNLSRRQEYQLYVLPEPDLSTQLDEQETPVEKSVQATKISFVYQDGPKNCEAIGVSQDGTQIWLVEKGYIANAREKSPGIYVLPLNLSQDLSAQKTPLVAKRIADFPPLNVTGMDFSPDGRQLIIRNYVNAHLYSRVGNQTWEQVVRSSKPETVVLPLQRQGEAICFSLDSKSVIVTSEARRQPIWQVNLKPGSAEKER